MQRSHRIGVRRCGLELDDRCPSLRPNEVGPDEHGDGWWQLIGYDFPNPLAICRYFAWCDGYASVTVTLSSIRMWQDPELCGEALTKRSEEPG